MSRLQPCLACGRHVRVSEPSCPFCRTGPAPARLTIALLGLGLVACTAPAKIEGGGQPEAAAETSAGAAEAASESSGTTDGSSAHERPPPPEAEPKPPPKPIYGLARPAPKTLPVPPDELP